MRPHLNSTLTLNETCLPQWSPMKLSKGKHRHSPLDYDWFEPEGKTTEWGYICNNKVNVLPKCSLPAKSKSRINVSRKCGGHGKNCQPLTIMHVTVSFGRIQLNSLQEEFFSLTLTTLEKQRKWMIQQQIRRDSSSPVPTWSRLVSTWKSPSNKCFLFI